MCVSPTLAPSGSVICLLPRISKDVFFCVSKSEFHRRFFSRIFLAWYLCVGGALGLWFMLGEEEQAT